MTTFETLQQSDWLQTELELMSSQEDSPAKTSQPLEDKQVLKVSAVDYGQSAPVLLGSFDRDTQSLRTSQTCLMENGELGLSEYSGTFPRSGMMRSGTVYQLPNLARTITEIGSGLWPTPDTTTRGARAEDLLVNSSTVQRRESGQKRGMDLQTAAKYWPTPRAQEAKHGAPTEWEMTTDHAGTRESLRVQVNKRQFWPTPTVQDSNKATKRWREDHQNNLTAHVFNPEKRMFPTPTSRDYKGGYKTESLIRRDGKSRAMDALPNAVLDGKGTETVTGQLNPTWVEWLMGFPLGHTDLKD